MQRFQLALWLLMAIILTTEVVANEHSSSEQLDQLFTTLKQATNETSARTIEQQIWKRWMVTGDPHIDGLMQRSLEARRWSDYDRALDLLDEVGRINPGYAEAWNQRATIYFLREEYEKALEHIAKTLELEPRHFGALAGRGVIRLRQGRSALAIQNIKAAMIFHPYLRERNLVPPQYLNAPNKVDQ